MINNHIKERLYLFYIENRYYLNQVEVSLFILFLYYLFIIFFSELLILFQDYYYFITKSIQTDLTNKEVIIYRIENDNHIGPYRSYNNFLDIRSSECHPTPFDDFKEIWMHLLFTNQYKLYKFGFKDMEQLNNWFTDIELDNLYNEGFKIVTYKSSHYYISDRQAIFK